MAKTSPSQNIALLIHVLVYVSMCIVAMINLILKIRIVLAAMRFVIIVTIAITDFSIGALLSL